MCRAVEQTLEGAVICWHSLQPNDCTETITAKQRWCLKGKSRCLCRAWVWYSNKDTSCPFNPDMSRFQFFSKRCICTDVKYIHQQGFSIAIEEKNGETQGLGEYNIVQTCWLGTAVAPCRPDCPCRSVLMSSSLPPSHRPKVWVQYWVSQVSRRTARQTCC